MFYILEDNDGFKTHFIEDKFLKAFFEDHSIRNYHTIFKTMDYEEAVSKLFEVLYEKNRQSL